MGAGGSDADRYIFRRGDIYHYQRRVPALVVDLDSRSPYVRVSLKTHDLALARAKRDAFERADDEYWASLLAGGSQEGAARHYKAAVNRAEILGFAYRSASDLAAHVDVDDILRRISTLSKSPPGSAVSEALLGMVDPPKVTVRQAFKVYTDEIMPHELVGKSDLQKKDWNKIKLRAVNNFIALFGDVPISGITRDQARQFYQMWMERIAPKKGPPTHSPSSGNRDLGNMRQLFQMYHEHLGERDKQNPFGGFSFSEKIKRTRPPFSVEWLTTKLLSAGSHIRLLNPEARAIVLIMIETGARPSEIANLDERTIFLDRDIPHIAIEPRDDPDDPREIKTASSVRVIPLVGVALAAAKAHPNGFPRYWNNERTLAATLNKTMRARGLLQTPKHTAYSIRHSFEDRMKEAKVDEELRRQLMGHVIDRPKYGSGGSLLLLQGELRRIALPFDPSIV